MKWSGVEWSRPTTHAPWPRVMAKLPHSVRSSEGCIAALELHNTIVTRTCSLLASKLGAEDLATLRRWLAMSAEEMSVRAGQRGVRMGTLGGGGGGGVSVADGTSGADGVGGAGGADVDGVYDTDSRDRSLEELYVEMKKVGEASVHIRRGGEGGRSWGGESTTATTTATRVVNSTSTNADVANKVDEDEGGGEGEGKGDNNGGDDNNNENGGEGGGLGGGDSSSINGGIHRSGSAPTFMSVAHLHGLCSLDELIAACESTGRADVSADLEVVKIQLRGQRVRSLIEAGVKTTELSNPLLDTMLFRYEDLFQKVVTTQVELRRRGRGRGRGDGDVGDVGDVGDTGRGRAPGERRWTKSEDGARNVSPEAVVLSPR